jgi:hypothetical protein
MKPDPRFVNQSKAFWAAVRSLGQAVGYTTRRQGQIKVPTYEEMQGAFGTLQLNPETIIQVGKPTAFADKLHDYFTYRAEALHRVRDLLMDGSEAKALFEQVRQEVRPLRPVPMNKQKGEKKAPAYLTGLVNMMIEKYASNLPCDCDPRQLTTVRKDGLPLRTLARRVDGAFPSPVNPIAVWEIKEYYYTTTFGSRVADGVYETLLDGMELEEIRQSEHIDIRHYLMIDAKFTWWTQGKSYLCRIVDMLHMGYVDEVLFGREVVDEMPRIVAEWCQEYGHDRSR